MLTDRDSETAYCPAGASASRCFLETAVFHVVLEAIDPLFLPPYKGSTIRGAFGTALRKMSCRTGEADCRDCPRRNDCEFAFIFITPLPPDVRMNRYSEATPHPFLIEPPLEERGEYEPGERLCFSLILIGRGIPFFDVFVAAFEEMGREGLGKKRFTPGRVRVREIRTPSGASIRTDGKTPPTFPIRRLDLPCDQDRGEGCLSQENFSLFFVTPTRICIEKRPVSERAFTGEHLVQNLVRRIANLHIFHGINGEPLPDIFGLVRAAAGIRTVSNELAWYDWERYSSRQDCRMSPGGFIGRIVFSGLSPEIASLLRAGEVVHLGKNTSMGMGKYIFSPGLRN
ncbi:MAG: CRISPR system precrRNA processing endoribonuclease RAMP protein Cas6 [Candidatus Aminicenantes bacterium]|nr:CRISPR system precrRNA processing endoribonuclease RAMP protein Cas6 [Candidatus Aminicenantes bacterium]